MIRGFFCAPTIAKGDGGHLIERLLTPVPFFSRNAIGGPQPALGFHLNGLASVCDLVQLALACGVFDLLGEEVKLNSCASGSVD